MMKGSRCKSKALDLEQYFFCQKGNEYWNMFYMNFEQECKPKKKKSLVYNYIAKRYQLLCRKILYQSNCDAQLKISDKSGEAEKSLLWSHFMQTIYLNKVIMNEC